MERLVEVMLKKVHIISSTRLLLQVIYIGFDSEGIMIQGSNEDQGILVTTVIPQDSLEHYECREPAL